MLYNVWVTHHTSSAKNAGIIGAVQAMKSSWATGKLTWHPHPMSNQENFLFAANNDQDAYDVLMKLYRERHTREKRELAGRSYMRQCRVTTDNK